MHTYKPRGVFCCASVFGPSKPLIIYSLGCLPDAGRVRPLRDWDGAGRRGVGGYTGGCACQRQAWNSPRDHFRNHHDCHSGDHIQTHLVSTIQSHPRNALSPLIERFCATWNVSQAQWLRVMLGEMRRRRHGFRSPHRDPKHVRDYFHKYALFTRVFHLCADGVWWIIATGFFRLFGWLGRLVWFNWPAWFWVNEPMRRLHTFIVGRTGVGKSVLLHNLIRHYLVWNRKPSLVLLDPHGDLARSVARDRRFRRGDRLVYVTLNGIAGAQISLNPFDLAKHNEHQLNRAQTQFAGAMEQIVGQKFTPVQRTIIRACLGVMLHRKDMTLVDLVRLLADEQNADLLRHGQSDLPNVIDRQFFMQSWGKSHYRATKQALVARLTDVVRDPFVRRFACQPSSFDLGAVLDSGKVLVVCFDPSKQSPDTIRAIGQLLHAAILSHVLGRTPYKRHPIHLFVDECQYFVSPTIADILGESRKFGLYATLATQRVERLDPDLQDAILGNVGTIWVGASRHTTAEKLAKETDLTSEQIRTLPNLSFFRVAGDRPATRQRLPFIGRRYAMTDKDWARILRQQAKRYYRKASEQPAPDPQTKATWDPYFS